jgi:hypothetical protein
MNTKFNLAAFPKLEQLNQQIDQVKADFKNHWNRQIEHHLAKLLKWVFSFPNVQMAVAQEISCHTPIGSLLNRHIDDCIEGADRDRVDADDVRGLDRYIEDALDSNPIDASNVRDFDQAVEKIIEDAEIDADMVKGLNEFVNEAVAKFIQHGVQVKLEIMN